MTEQKRGPGRPRKENENNDKAAAVDVEDLMSANNEFADENDRLSLQNETLKRQMSDQSFMINTMMKRFEALEQQIGQDGTSRFKGDALIQVEKRPLDSPEMLAKLDIEKFMEEMVTVEVHDVADENADPAFPIWVNGIPEFFRRGEQKTVKRKFVEGLARAKKTGYRNVLKVDPMTGEQEYVWPSKTGLRYPFSVVSDNNKEGSAWLKAVLRQP